MKKVSSIAFLLMALLMVTSCQKELPEGFSDYMISQGGTGQGEDSPEISLDTNSMEFTAEGGSRSFNIKSNTSWTLSSDKSWCTVSPTLGRNNSSVMVTVEKNTATSARTAIITVKSEIGILTVKVTQNGATQSHDYSNDYLTFVALENGTFTFFAIGGNGPIQYSLDSGSTWSTLSRGAASPTVSAGNTIMWKGNLTPVKPDIEEPDSGIGTFSSTGNFNVKGNIMSLLYGDDFENKIDLTGKDFAFMALFAYCTGLTNAENLVLPATTLAEDCYGGMFSHCTSLTTAPSVLPATTLAEDCYGGMFYNCTSLKTAPVLNATTLAEFCYFTMFQNCTSLKTAPSLPATTLTENCYNKMFSGCTSLTTAPQLPATTLASYCYDHMFSNCTSLTTAPELPATTIFQCCYWGLFSGCTSLTTAPSLPATNLSNAYACYEEMFAGCTSLTIAPSLPATTLEERCYNEMFSGCTSLTTAPQLPATTLASDCYRSMFEGCTSLTTAPQLPATTLARACYMNMFNACTSLITAPELPATTLAEFCYYYMFTNCTSLTAAPVLPATKLVLWSYGYMFSGCTKLNYIECHATNIRATNCTFYWVDGVKSSGTFIKNVSMSNWTTGVSGIPSGWTVQFAATTRRLTTTMAWGQTCPLSYSPSKDCSKQ